MGNPVGLHDPSSSHSIKVCINNKDYVLYILFCGHSFTGFHTSCCKIIFSIEYISFVFTSILPPAAAHDPRSRYTDYSKPTDRDNKKASTCKSKYRSLRRTF